MFVLVLTSALRPRKRTSSDRLHELSRFKTSRGMVQLAIRRCEDCTRLFWGKKGYNFPYKAMRYTCPLCQTVKRKLPSYVRMLTEREMALIAQHLKDSGCQVRYEESIMVTQ